MVTKIKMEEEVRSQGTQGQGRRISVLPRRIMLSLCLLLVAIAQPATATGDASYSVAREWNEELLKAIRLDVPDPPAHARNLFHTAAAMYAAWASYDSVAVGYLFHEKVAPLPVDVEAARHEAISYAAYRVLRSRFADGVSATTTLASLDAKLLELGYSPKIGQAPITNDATPAELGKRAAAAILAWGVDDAFDNLDYPEAYTVDINPNLAVPLPVQGQNHRFQDNMPLGFGIPPETDPNFWQPLSLSARMSQNGISFTADVQSYIGLQGMAVTPFSLSREDPAKPWLNSFGGPSRLSVPGQTSETDAVYKANALEVLLASSQLNAPTLIDISPGAIGNNALGTDDGEGFPVNPVTGQAYAPNLVTRGDFTRVLAEYWADGPDSETPPGHWHVLANEVVESPSFSRRIGGVGPVVNALEWDVKMYFGLSAAMHDAACAAWAMKRYYSSPRPITMIRYMGDKGQSSDPAGPSYHSQGLPLVAGVVEVITAATVAAGERHESIWDVGIGDFAPGSDFIGEIAVYSWPGEHPNNPPAPSVATHQSTNRWMLAKDWLPFQRKSFNNPAFPGYVSGHSTFSRAGAEVMAQLTGSPYFPGGFHHYTVSQNSLQIDLGPSTDVELQWCTYYDAADQAGRSRIYGGIHPPEDDYPGRHIGAEAGMSAVALAEKYWDGTILEEPVPITIHFVNGVPDLRWQAVRGMYQKVQYSDDLITWHDATASTLTYDTRPAWTDASPDAGARFYRVVWSPISEVP